jgi:hypothetical protein
MDLGFLRRELAIGLNKIHLGIRRFRFYPRYYVAVNDHVIMQSAIEIQRLNCVKFLSARNRQHVANGAMTYFIDTVSPPCRFCRDVSEGVHEGGSVTYAALQVAFFLGFQEVVIIGLDHRYEFSGLPNETNVLKGPDPNHFAMDYFGGGQVWDNPDLRQSAESFRIARDVYEAEGRRILDATVGGACEVFEKADYRKVFEVLA